MDMDIQIQIWLCSKRSICYYSPYLRNFFKDNDLENSYYESKKQNVFSLFYFNILLKCKCILYSICYLW